MTGEGPSCPPCPPPGGDPGPGFWGGGLADGGLGDLGSGRWGGRPRAQGTVGPREGGSGIMQMYAVLRPRGDTGRGNRLRPGSPGLLVGKRSYPIGVPSSKSRGLTSAGIARLSRIRLTGSFRAWKGRRGRVTGRSICKIDWRSNSTMAFQRTIFPSRRERDGRLIPSRRPMRWRRPSLIFQSPPSGEQEV